MIAVALYMLGVAHMYMWLAEEASWDRPRWWALFLAFFWPIWTCFGLYDHINKMRKDRK